MLTEYEATVLQAHRDNDPDAVKAGVTLASTCGSLWKNGLMDQTGTLTEAGHEALAEFERRPTPPEED